MILDFPSSEIIHDIVVHNLKIDSYWYSDIIFSMLICIVHFKSSINIYTLRAQYCPSNIHVLFIISFKIHRCKQKHQIKTDDFFFHTKNPVIWFHHMNVLDWFSFLIVFKFTVTFFDFLFLTTSSFWFDDVLHVLQYFILSLKDFLASDISCTVHEHSHLI